MRTTSRRLLKRKASTAAAAAATAATTPTPSPATRSKKSRTVEAPPDPATPLTSGRGRTRSRRSDNPLLKVQDPDLRAELREEWCSRRRKIYAKSDARTAQLKQDYDTAVARVEVLEQEVAELNAKTATMQQTINTLHLERKKSDEVLRLKAFNAIIDHYIKEFPAKKQRKAEFHKFVPPAVLTDHEVLVTVARALDLTPRALARVNLGRVTQNERMRVAEEVAIQFVYRNEYSLKMAGKKDRITIKGVPYQKVSLLFDMKYLHKLYAKEYKGTRFYVGYNKFTKFIRCRPWIRQLGREALECCICKTHQNYKLLLKPVVQATKGQVEEGSEGNEAGFPSSVEALFRTYSKDQLELVLKDRDRRHSNLQIYDRLPVEVKFKQWMLVPVLVGNPDAIVKTFVKKLRPVDCTLHRDLFIQKILDNYDAVKYHSDLAINQHVEVRDQREELSWKECTVQMDFAQNWLIGFGEGGEIQSVFFNKDGIMVHPVVIHYRKEGDTHTSHQSLCFVSDDRKHDAGAISEILRLVTEYIRKHLKGVEVVHYWTDSPSSQYRNISMFSLICHHEELYGLRCTWNYFEAGHGKGN